ncbi:MAG: HAMP domain-containing histidine kinase [Desulfobacula sp.]|nr:HAMP domain-containing histidine kinase [Desulfobacula sp.]
MSIFKRLILGNLIILLIVAFWGGAVTYKLSNLQKITRNIVHVNSASMIIGDRLLDSFTSLVKSIKKYYVSVDMDYYQRVLYLNVLIEKDFEHLSHLIESEQQLRQLFSDIKLSYIDLMMCFEENISLVKKDGSITDLKDHNFELEQIIINLKEIINQNKQQISENTDLTNRLIRQIFIMTLIITALTVLLGGFIALTNTRAITRSISSFKEKTKEISQGDFKELQTIAGPSEIRELSSHFNAMSQRLRELDDLKGDFISHVSHELRTPVTAIKEASIMLSKDLYSDHPQKLYELYALIQEECDRLLNSALRLLDYSKMEARAMEYQFTDFDLALNIRKSILKLAPMAHKKNIDLEFSPPPELPMLSADGDRIREILDNLMGNALKFTPIHGRILVKCLLDKKNKRVIISIIDNGCGIKPEYLDAIFEKFRQIDNGIGTRMGTGLGLSISKHIVKAHGGDIWAESDYPNGTQLFFTLPFYMKKLI